MTVRVVALTLVALAFTTTTAAAQGNPPIEALLPAEGAALPISPAGIELRYSCPVYIVSGEPPFATYGGRRDYGTVVATRPDVGNDGRLLQSNWIDLPPSDDLQDNDLPEDQCRTSFAEDNWHLTPGTYYWQAYRICLACPGGYEATPVRSFRLTAERIGDEPDRHAAAPGLRRHPLPHRGRRPRAAVGRDGPRPGASRLRRLEDHPRPDRPDRPRHAGIDRRRAGPAGDRALQRARGDGDRRRGDHQPRRSA